MEPTITLEELKNRGYLHDCICDWEWTKLPVKDAYWWVRIRPSSDCPTHKGW